MTAWPIVTKRTTATIRALSLSLLRSPNSAKPAPFLAIPAYAVDAWFPQPIDHISLQTRDIALMVPSQAKPPAAMARSLDMAAMSKATAMSFRSQRRRSMNKRSAHSLSSSQSGVRAGGSFSKARPRNDLTAARNFQTAFEFTSHKRLGEAPYPPTPAPGPERNQVHTLDFKLRQPPSLTLGVLFLGRAFSVTLIIRTCSTALKQSGYSMSS